jgi:hypothetical protein
MVIAVCRCPGYYGRHTGGVIRQVEGENIRRDSRLNGQAREACAARQLLFAPPVLCINVVTEKQLHSGSYPRGDGQKAHFLLWIYRSL